MALFGGLNRKSVCWASMVAMNIAGHRFEFVKKCNVDLEIIMKIADV